MSDNKDMPGQVSSDGLDIHDEQKGTRGGPPMWMAMVIVGGLFLLGCVIVVVIIAAAG